MILGQRTLFEGCSHFKGEAHPMKKKCDISFKVNYSYFLLSKGSSKLLNLAWVAHN